MIFAVVGSSFLFRRSDIPPLAPMLTSNWGRHRMLLLVFHSFLPKSSAFLIEQLIFSESHGS
jgi:hypothetical protein